MATLGWDHGTKGREYALLKGGSQNSKKHEERTSTPDLSYKCIMEIAEELL